MRNRNRRKEESHTRRRGRKEENKTKHIKEDVGDKKTRNKNDGKFDEKVLDGGSRWKHNP